jgi:hypothetical protein
MGNVHDEKETLCDRPIVHEVKRGKGKDKKVKFSLSTL